VIPADVGIGLKQRDRNIDRLIAFLGDKGFDEAREEDRSKAVAQVAEWHCRKLLLYPSELRGHSTLLSQVLTVVNQSGDVGVAF